MRIISGKFKGHRLVSFKADHIRPTTDRVKETLFNKLTGYIEGAAVLDLFCGTGNLGLEALSRGAAFVEFVDSNEKSLRILGENVKKLKLSEDFHVTKRDALQYLKNPGREFDLIFIDPPFTRSMADEVLKALSESHALKAGGLVAIEAGTKEPIQDEYASIKLYDRKEFGDKSLCLYQKSADGSV